MAEKNTNIGAVFGEVLREYRERAGLSQEELAFRASVDRTFVSRLERGVRQPTLTTLIGLGGALNTSATKLIRRTEELLAEKEAPDGAAWNPRRGAK